MSTGDFPIPRNRASDKRWRYKASNFWLTYSFVWGPLLVMLVVAAISYPAKIRAEDKLDTSAKIDSLATRLDRRITRLETRDSIAERKAVVRDELLRALVRIRCDDLSPGEIRRLGIPCDDVKLEAPR